MMQMVMLMLLMIKLLVLMTLADDVVDDDKEADGDISIIPINSNVSNSVISTSSLISTIKMSTISIKSTVDKGKRDPPKKGSEKIYLFSLKTEAGVRGGTAMPGGLGIGSLEVLAQAIACYRELCYDAYIA